MKKVIALISSLFTTTLLAYTPLDIKPGMWVYKTDPSAVIESALANVPEAQRAMVKTMMEKMGKDKMPGTTVYQCQTKEIINDPEAIFKQQAKGNDKMKDCDFKVVESTKKKAAFTLKCPNGLNANVRIVVKSSTEHDTYAKVKMPEAPQDTEMKTTATWKGSDCSKVEELNKEAMKISIPNIGFPGQ